MTPGDFDDLLAMYQNSDVMKTLGGVKERSQVLESLDRFISHFNDYGYSYWHLEDQKTGIFAGRAGLLNTHIDGRNVVELGYAYLPEFWGKGIATEVGKEIIRIALYDLGFKEIFCFTLPENKASIRVIEKLGFVFQKECVYKGFVHALYRISVP